MNTCCAQQRDEREGSCRSPHLSGWRELRRYIRPEVRITHTMNTQGRRMRQFDGDQLQPKICSLPPRCQRCPDGRKKSTGCTSHLRVRTSFDAGPKMVHSTRPAVCTKLGPEARERRTERWEVHPFCECARQIIREAFVPCHGLPTVHPRPSHLFIQLLFVFRFVVVVQK